MEAIIEKVKSVIDSGVLTQRQLAKQAGIGEAVLSALLKGNYKGDIKKNISALTVWYGQYTKQQEQAARQLKEPGYLPLPTSEKIMQLMAMAQNLGRWSMAYEGSGVGKTFSALEYQRNHRNVWIVTVCSDFGRTSSYILDELAEQLGLKLGSVTLARKKKAIQEALDGTQGLIVIDEAQYLSDNTLNGLRILSEGRVGVMLLGNDVVRTRMNATRSEINMRPVWSRIIHPERIEKSSGEDIAGLLDGWGIHDASIKAYALKMVPKTNGQLRTLGDMIKLAGFIADKDTEALSLRHIQSAHHYLMETV